MESAVKPRSDFVFTLQRPAAAGLATEKSSEARFFYIDRDRDRDPDPDPDHDRDPDHDHDPDHDPDHDHDQYLFFMDRVIFRARKIRRPPSGHTRIRRAAVARLCILSP